MSSSLRGCPWAALGIPLEARVRQIELALERIRWLPHRFPAPPVAVNIPEFRLYALRPEGDRYERADDRLTMRVIVGEAWRRQTPVFAGEMRLASPVPVYVLYVTAVARADSTVHFFEDLYGLDAKLDALLAEVPADA